MRRWIKWLLVLCILGGCSDFPGKLPSCVFMCKSVDLVAPLADVVTVSGSMGATIGGL